MIAGVLAVLLSTFFFNASAQSFTGKVIDENDMPLAYANVILHRADTTFIAGTVTDTSGVFILDPHSEGAMIQVSFVSYETCYLTITDKNLGTIKMEPDAQMLDKVVVKAVLPRLKLSEMLLLRILRTVCLQKQVQPMMC